MTLLVSGLPALGAGEAENTYLFALKAYRDGLYETSAEAFREYLASSPPRARRAKANLFLGQALLSLGRNKEALAALNAAARGDSKARVAPLARLLRARLYLEMARYKDSEAETGRWLSYFPRHPLRWEVLLVRGRALAGLKRWDEAAALLDEVAGAEKASPELSAAALSSLAAMRAHQGKSEEASAAWEVLVERFPADPRSAQARLQLAARSARAGRLEEALGKLDTLLKKFPKAPEAGPAKLLRAESLFGLERFSEAAEAYSEAARAGGAELLGPSHWERAGLAAYRSGRFKEASDALARAGDGPDGVVLALRLKALRKMDKPAETLKASSRLLSSYPRSRWAADALWPTLELARKTGMWAEARRALSAYEGGAPASRRLEARYGLAHAELYGGRPAEAARLFKSVADDKEGLDRYRDVRYKRAVALAAAGRHMAAAEALEELGEKERSAVGAEAVLGLEADVRKAQGHYGAAAERYQALLARAPEAKGSGRWLLGLAEVEEARGRSAEALRAYERWLEARAEDPGAPEVRLAAARLMVTVGRRDDAWANLDAIGTGADPGLAARAFLMQGRIAFEERDYEAALAASAKALKGSRPGSPTHALARWRMARVLEATGKPADAAVHYRWLAKHAEDAEVREASGEGLARLSAKAKGPKKGTP